MSNIQDINNIISTMEAKGYKVFKTDKDKYDLNIVGLRSDNLNANKFDDQLWVFWGKGQDWELRKYTITTDPGDDYLEKPLPETPGTAILKEGQYRGSHEIGFHGKKYEALRQRKKVTVYRDNDLDTELDMEPGTEQSGSFNINIHRATDVGSSSFVNNWSAGCQVFQHAEEFAEFMYLCHMQVARGTGKSFSYTLMRKADLG